MLVTAVHWTLVLVAYAVIDYARRPSGSSAAATLTWVGEGIDSAIAWPADYPQGADVDTSLVTAVLDSTSGAPEGHLTFVTDSRCD
jgi:hypothetical protein